MDCGIRPSPKARYGLAGDQLPDLSLIDGFGSIDLVLVTHAHTDHTGGLERILECFPHVSVYAMPPTVALTRVLHQDEESPGRRLQEMAERGHGTLCDTENHSQITLVLLRSCNMIVYNIRIDDCSFVILD